MRKLLKYFFPFLVVIFISEAFFFPVYPQWFCQYKTGAIVILLQTRYGIKVAVSGIPIRSILPILLISISMFISGCIDSTGADGIAFVLQPISTNVGDIGEGLGFEGVSPSVGISLDTWQNLRRNDPSYDHISIQLNGVVTHGSDLAGPVPASATSDNIEDCQWHVLRYYLGCLGKNIDHLV